MMGYGPARLYRSNEVKEIFQALSNISEGEIRKNFNPSEMDRLQIYPDSWTDVEEEGLENLVRYFRGLKEFVSECSENDLGFATFIC